MIKQNKKKMINFKISKKRQLFEETTWEKTNKNSKRLEKMLRV